MGFDFDWTCPKIDRMINDLQGDLEDMIYDILHEASPMIPHEELQKIAKEYSVKYYSSTFEDLIEKVRDTNIDMRKEANDQIEKHEKRIEELEENVEELEDEIFDLKKENENLKDELESKNS
jgi:chromosome segregation ATPase